MLKTIHNKFFYIGLVAILILVLAFFVLPNLLPANFANNLNVNLASVASTSSTTATTTEPVIIKRVITHVPTPEAVKGIYMTACVAGTPSFRAKLLKLAQETEINSIVIDIKDYTGTVSFEIDDPEFQNNLGGGCRVKDMVDFVETLHQNNIYVIGRITAFQDPQMTRAHPEWAVKRMSDKSVVWKDRKGLSFVDAGAKPMWQYLVNLSKYSYEAGFDEINFDYIRFPSDGDMKDIYYPWSTDIWATAKNNLAITQEIASTTGTTTATTTKPVVKLSDKALVMESFFKFLHQELKDTGMKLSVDFFGMTATNYDDLNIGQVLETAVPYFDYIAPMVYPSHYPVGFMGYKSVAEVNAHPYDIVNFSMAKAVERVKVMGEDPLKLRPWLQDNDYPVPYSPAMVRAQIQATYDAGLTSWMLWDAGNTYTQSALEIE
jgi:hypothetical protein